MPGRRRFLILFLSLLLALVVAPVSAWAVGPVPPRSPFWAPPTPTLAPLPEPETTPEPAFSPAEETAVELPAGVMGPRVFLPLLRRVTLPAEATNAVAPPPADAAPAPAVTFVPTPDPQALPIHSDPITTSFIYQLQAGDTLSELAIEFGRDQASMTCAQGTDGRAFHDLQPGDSIVIPALSDLCHVVKPGETLTSIADWYEIGEEELAAVLENHLSEGATLRPGQRLFIPNARDKYRDPSALSLPRAPSTSWRYGDGKFIWPVARDKVGLSQGFKHGKHMALDLAGDAGTPVLAADTGMVVKAGWSDNGYGYRIVIDHGIDYITLYAHLSEYYVQPGDIVRKGDVIGAVGSTGNSTGPHLHFEVRDYGYLIDPLLALPK